VPFVTKKKGEGKKTRKKGKKKESGPMGDELKEPLRIKRPFFATPQDADNGTKSGKVRYKYR